MGRPKALLLFDDIPLIVHIVTGLRRLFAEVVVVSTPGQVLPSMPVTLVHDDVEYQGPVGGICYGLAATSREVSFVTSCDSAFLNAGLISHLVSGIADHDVVVPCWGGRLQPLHAVYRKGVLPLLEAQLVRGELRSVYLFDRVRTRRLDEDEVRRFDPEGESFFNMNTPDDYAEALERWRAGRRPGGDVRTGFVDCTVELFGVARLVAQTREVSLALPSGATLAQVFEALAAKLPVLIGRVIEPDTMHLVDGYACNLNGLEFMRNPSALVNPGDRIVILSADAGG
jgi:molybdopterin-guanine dinucleotide biosynthesis protein A